MKKKFLLPVVLAFAAVTALPATAYADCAGVQCYVSGTGDECVDPETCPLCFKDTYVLTLGPYEICVLP